MPQNLADARQTILRCPCDICATSFGREEVLGYFDRNAPDAVYLSDVVEDAHLFASQALKARHLATQPADVLMPDSLT